MGENDWDNKSHRNHLKITVLVLDDIDQIDFDTLKLKVSTRVVHGF